MKEIKAGDAFYSDKGLRKVVADLSEATDILYEKERKRLMKKHKNKWSRRSFFSYWLEKKKPK